MERRERQIKETRKSLVEGLGVKQATVRERSTLENAQIQKGARLIRNLHSNLDVGMQCVEFIQAILSLSLVALEYQKYVIQVSSVQQYLVLVLVEPALFKAIHEYVGITWRHLRAHCSLVKSVPN